MTEPTETEFQVTVPSNSCIEVYPNNRPNHFTMELTVKRELDERWQVALMELQFPIHYPLSSPMFEIQFSLEKNSDGSSIVNNTMLILPAERHKSYADFASNFMNSIESKIQMTAEHKFNLEFDVVKRQFKFIASPDSKLVWKTPKDDLWLFIGFSNKTLVNFIDGGYYLSVTGSMTGDPMAAIKQYPCMYVYSDVVRQQEVGGSLAQLLETVPVSAAATPGSQVSYLVNPPRYQSVAKHLLDKIEIQINTHTGAPWPLDAEDEQVIARLSFRRKPMQLLSA